MASKKGASVPMGTGPRKAHTGSKGTAAVRRAGTAKGPSVRKASGKTPSAGGMPC